MIVKSCASIMMLVMVCFVVHGASGDVYDSADPFDVTENEQIKMFNIVYLASSLHLGSTPTTTLKGIMVCILCMLNGKVKMYCEE